MIEMYETSNVEGVIVVTSLCCLHHVLRDIFCPEALIQVLSIVNNNLFNAVLSIYIWGCE